VNIALPVAQRDLGFSIDDRQWVVTGYALALGSLLLLGGRLSDLFGRKRLFLIGVGGFALASAVGGAAADFPMLLAARVAQGAFAAMLAPAALSLVPVREPGHRGGRVRRGPDLAARRRPARVGPARPGRYGRDRPRPGRHGLRFRKLRSPGLDRSLDAERDRRGRGSPLRLRADRATHPPPVASPEG